MPIKVDRGLNLVVRRVIDNEFTENEGTIYFNGGCGADIFDGLREPIYSLEEEFKPLSHDFDSALRVTEGDNRYFILSRCAWDHSLYHTISIRDQEDTGVKVAFYQWINDEFSYVGVDTYTDLDINSGFMFLDRYTFISQCNRECHMFFLEESKVIKKLNLRYSFFGALGQYFYLLSNTFIYLVRMSRSELFEMEKFTTLDVHSGKISVLSLGSDYYRKQTLTDSFVFANLSRASKGYYFMSFTVVYMENDKLCALELIDYFPLISTLGKVEEVEFLKLELDSPQKILVMYASVNSRDCLIVFKGKEYQIFDYSYLRCHFGAKMPFSRNFSTLKSYLTRYMFSNDQLMKTNSVYCTDNLFICFRSKFQSITCVFSTGMVFEEEDQLIRWDIENNTICSTRRWAHWSNCLEDSIELYNRTSIPHYLVYQEQEYHLCCYNMQDYDPSDPNSVVTGYNVILDSNIHLLSIKNDSIMFYTEHNNEEIFVFEYNTITEECKLLFDVRDNDIFMCKLVDVDRITIYKMGNSLNYVFDGENWVRDLKLKYHLKRGVTTVTLDDDQHIICDSFVKSVNDNVSLFRGGAYLISHEAFAERPAGYKLVDLYELGMMAKSDNTFVFTNGFVIANVDNVDNVIRHHTYIFDESGGLVESIVKEKDLYTGFSEATYYDFTYGFFEDCDLSYRNLHRVDLQSIV
ncbi:hypothetical protein PCE1_003835 [Barthelona sp. PCE]